MRSIFALALVAVLSGCSSVHDVARLEGEAFKQDPEGIVVPTFYTANDFDHSIAIAYQLSEAYFQLSANASRTQDIAALGLIASAAVAAGGLLFGSGTDLIAGAGLGAGTIAAGTGYLEPGEASLRLVQAGNQMICLVGAAEQTNRPIDGQSATAKELYAANPAFDAERRTIMSTSIATVRGNLRLHLQRQLPDYGTLVTDLLAAARAGQSSPELLDVGVTDELKRRNDQFREAAGKCVIA